MAVRQHDIDFVKQAMVGVTSNPDGTAYSVFRGAPYLAGGKTGTAQVFSLRGGEYRAHLIPERLRDHALFIAFAPADHPSIAVALVVENGGWGTKTAAPVVRKVLDYWLVDRFKPGVAASEVAAAAAGAVQSAHAAAMIGASAGNPSIGNPAASPVLSDGTSSVQAESPNSVLPSSPAPLPRVGEGNLHNISH
jgi:penicillin-binding protein 2